MNEPTIEYSKRVVAFIDILGFENLVRSLPDKPELFVLLGKALRKIKNMEIKTPLMIASGSDREVSVFSDSIVISTKEEDLLSIVLAAGSLQANLMRIGVFTRGGIAIGPTIHKDGILYGEGFLSAYRLEQKAAVYPRIVIAKNLATKYEKDTNNYKGYDPFKNIIAVDADSTSFINPFELKFVLLPSNAHKLAADSHDPRVPYMQDVREHIMKNIENASEEDHLAKYRWLAYRFNVALSDFSDSDLEKIDLTLS